MEILKQDQFAPLPMEEQVLLFFAGIGGFLDEVPLEEVRSLEAGLLEHLRATRRSLLERIRNEKTFDDAIKEEATEAIRAFIETHNTRS